MDEDLKLQFRMREEYFEACFVFSVVLLILILMHIQTFTIVIALMVMDTELL